VAKPARGGGGHISFCSNINGMGEHEFDQLLFYFKNNHHLYKPKSGSVSINSLSEDSIPLTQGSSYQPTY
jgi:hypothetical protein